MPTATVKDWYHAGIVTGQRYNDKGQVLYNPPDPPTRPTATKTGRPTTTTDLHERQLDVNRPEEVQYAARGLSLGL